MDFLNSIILLGALQGFIVSGLLFFYKGKLTDRLLGYLILVISLACLNLYLLEIGLPRVSKFWHNVSLVVPLIIAMPIGPLVYFYVQMLVGSKTRLDNSDYLHFYPIVLDLLPRLAGSLMVISHAIDWLPYANPRHWNQFIDLCDVYLDIVRWISISAYTAMALRLVVAAKSGRAVEADFHWARKVVYGFVAFQLLWLVHLVPYIIPPLSDDLLAAVRWYPVYIPLAVMAYWLGINGFLLRAHSKSESQPLSAQVIEETTNRLLHCMEQDKMYLDAELNLNTVVMKTGIPQKTISAVLNHELGKSFNEFVNRYRVEAVKRRLQDGHQHLTITGVAFESGFNSQATFQRAFKQVTGLTPTEFLSGIKKIRGKSIQI